MYILYTSKKVGHSFDVNKRFVYAMQSLEKRHAAAKKFCAMMDMPPSPKPTAYWACDLAILKAAKCLGCYIEAAAKNLKNSLCAVSCDGNWQ